jgi:hypothetical protein
VVSRDDTIMSTYERRTPLNHKLMDDLVRTTSDIGIVGSMAVILTLVLAVFWILLPFVVCAVQRSTYKSSRELQVLNKKMDLILSTIEAQSKASKDFSPLDTVNSITTDRKVT